LIKDQKRSIKILDRRGFFLRHFAVRRSPLAVHDNGNMKRSSAEFAIPPLKASPLSTIDHVYSELKGALIAGEF